MNCVYLKNVADPVCNAVRDELHLTCGETDMLCRTAGHVECSRYRYAKELEPGSQSFQPWRAIGLSVRA